MIPLFDPAPLQAYHDVWCSDELRRTDPEGCSVGLAIGYGWFPLLILLALATLVYLVVSGLRVIFERKEEKACERISARLPPT